MIGALAIVLARAGSKGVPGKNIAPVGGVPCLLWTLRAAQAARGVARTILSTDDATAARVARDHGVDVIARPAALAHDTARVDDAARHAASEADPRGEHPFIVILYANVPVRPPDAIDRALDLLRSTACDSVQSYQPVGKNHPWWTARLDPSGQVRPWEGELLNHGVFRRQDLPPAFIPDGAVIALRRQALMLDVPGAGDGPHAFFGVDRRGIINPEGSVVDIDSPIDLLVADAILSRRA